jgi:hypothetical protein
MAINREQMLAVCQRRYTTVDVPCLGELRIQSLTAGEMRAIRASLRTKAHELDKERFDKLDALVVAAAWVDDNGNLCVSDDDVMRGFFDRIDGGPWAVITAAVKRHTGWDCGEDWQSVKAAAKN